jgi:hypothetical protein
MDTTERTRRFNLLQEGIENKNNKMILNSAVSSLYCRLSTVTQEVFFDIFSTIKDVKYLNDKNNVKIEDENEEDEYNYEDSDEDLLTREEYNLIVNKLFDMIKKEL